MNDRTRAISILQQARDILAERLTERVLESRDSILEDALGLSYSSEIDTLHEQVGQRLNNVNVLLGNLPPMDDPPATDDHLPQETPALGYEPDSTAVALRDADATADSVIFSSAGEPEPAVYATLIEADSDRPRPAAISFQSFAEHVMANDVEGAGIVLAGLFDVSVDRGRQCAKRFQEQLAERPQFLQKAMGLRYELSSGSINGSLILLWECFGLQGMESLSALQSLKARLSLSGAS